MRDFNVIAKGNYTHKQTNEFLHVDRFLIVRKKKGRVLLLNLNNLSEEKLTGLRLQIDQFDVRGKSLGFTTVELDDLAVEHGEYVLKKEIAVHRACIDFRVQVLLAEYGNFAYRLGDNDTYITYEKPLEKSTVNRAKMRKRMGNRNFTIRERRFGIPLFVSAFLAALLFVTAGFYAVYAYTYKNNSYGGNGTQTFYKSNVLYRFASENYDEKTPVDVVGYTGIGGSDIVIPSKVDGHTVQSVKESAFEGNLLVESVTVGSGVRIEKRAFADCFQLKSVTVQGVGYVAEEAFADCVSLESFSAQNLSVIGDNAFYGCHALDTVRIVGTEAEGTLTIGSNAFYDCRTFDEIYINRFIQYGNDLAIFNSATEVDSLYLQNYNYVSNEETVATDSPLSALFGGREVKVGALRIAYTNGIPDNFMQGCEDTLTSVKISNMSSTVIGAYAFADCKNLREVSLPVAVTEVGERAFAETDVASFNAKNIKTLGSGAFYHCEELSDFDLSANSVLTNIPTDAFGGCIFLKSVTIPKTVTNVGSGAFSGCENVETLTFASGSKLTNVMPDAFAGCRKIRTLTLPSGIESVRENAFADCRALRSLTIPAGKHDISDKAFTNCYKLYEIENYGNQSIHVGYGIAKYAFRVYTSESDTRLEKQVSNGFVLAEKNGEWYVIDYQGKGGETTLPSGVNGQSYTVISHLFGENETVTGVTVSADVSALGNEVFLDSAVKNVVIKDGLSDLQIQADTFKGCTTLEKVSINRNIGELYESAFEGCKNLKEVSLPGSVTKITKAAFYGCSSLQTVRAENSTLKGIEDGAFYGCSALENLPRTELVRTVGNRAFYDCESLSSFVAGHSISSVGAEAFYGCKSLNSIELYSGELGEKAFADCRNLTSAKIYASITELGESTFEDCVRLRSVALSGTIEKIGKKAFYGCTSLTDVTLPSATTDVAANAFRGCTSLRTVSGGGSVKALGNKAFYGCTNLESATTFRSLAEIGAEAFRGCESLHTFTTSSYLKTMGERAFYGCASLKEVTFISTAPIMEIPAEAYKNCTALEVVTLSAELIRIGDGAFENTPMLYEVYDLSDYLNVTVGGSENGYLGYNALVVNTNRYADRLSSSTSGDFEFRYRGTEKFLVKYTGKASALKLDSISTFTQYEIAKNAFAEYEKAEKLTIGAAVKGIRSGAFTGLTNLRELRFVESSYLLCVPKGAFQGCENLQSVLLSSTIGEVSYNAIDTARTINIYYTGNESTWNNNAIKYGFGDCRIYYFDVCRHHEGEWNYENGEIATGARGYDYRVVVEPSCESAGDGMYYCDTCDYSEMTKIESLGHNYTDCQCTRCGKLYTTRMWVYQNSLSNAKKFLEFRNESKIAYDLFKINDEQIRLGKTESGQSSILQIVAKANVNLSFVCTNNDSYGTFEIVSSGQSWTVDFNGYQRIDLTLYQGDSVRISYTMWSGTSSSPDAYISEMYISSLN